MLLFLPIMACVPPLYPTELNVDVNVPPIITPELEPRITQDPIDVNIAVGCGAESFIAPVVDYDGDERVFYKWILTAVLSGANTQVVQRVLDENDSPTTDDPALVAAILGEEAPLAAPTTRVVNPGVRLELSPDLIRSRFDFPDSLVGNEKTHLLELFVSDRDFESGVLNVEPKRDPGEPRQIPARAAWVLTVISVESCQQ